MKGIPGRIHGTHSCYVGGCRQDECRAAHREYVKANYKPRKVDPGPFTLVLGMLYRAGESPALIARHTGIREPTIIAIALGERSYITTPTAKRLRSVIDLIPEQA